MGAKTSVAESVNLVTNVREQNGNGFVRTKDEFVIRMFGLPSHKRYLWIIDKMFGKTYKSSP